MKSRLYACPRYRKDVKFISYLTKYIIPKKYQLPCQVANLSNKQQYLRTIRLITWTCYQTRKIFVLRYQTMAKKESDQQITIVIISD